ncbi:hypothetical protein ABEB36_004752 [Hypothenemus hampei]|uniref:HTH OST-type domain-containing protein n=1 Tax=Hypothenemus hampei TaxID=57062 RepID=A0ABD1ECS1_HYPHA
MEGRERQGVVRRRRRVVRVRYRRFPNFNIPIETHRVVLAEVTRRVREMKVVISGILDPVPAGMTLDQFLRDYRQKIGMELPYQGLGFDDPLSMLVSFPDICSIATCVDMEDPGPEDTWIHPVRDSQVFSVRIVVQENLEAPEESLDD